MPGSRQRYLLATAALTAAAPALAGILLHLHVLDVVGAPALSWLLLAAAATAAGGVVVLGRAFADRTLRPLLHMAAALEDSDVDARLAAPAKDAAPEVRALETAIAGLRARLRTSARLGREDPLTGLANRMEFQQVLQEAIAQANRTQQRLALICFDLDRFKDINDTFGHAAGDAALETVARRIVAELPEGTVAGRLAGDEFAALLSGAGADDLPMEASAVAERLLQAVGRPLEVHDEEIFLTTSIGIALCPHDGDNVFDLVRNAGAALLRAKRAGGNCLARYTSEMSTSAVERLMLKSRLRRAFEREELRLHYQPKYNLRNGCIEGAEALIRWNVPGRGLVFPSDFIPLAEETNLILQIGDWVLDRVCADYRLWQRCALWPCRVSVNLSLRQLHQQRFLERVRRTLRTHGVSPACVELEITETTLMEDAHRMERILHALYGMGLQLALDDFGTGYSSLSALRQFPISTLKIDRSFVRDVPANRDSVAIVSAIIRLAHGLKLEVVAEGVESARQLRFLRENACDHAQGHLFGDPMTAEAFGALLREQAAGTRRHQALFA